MKKKKEKFMKKKDLKSGNILVSKDGDKFLYHKRNSKELLNIYGDTIVDLKDYTNNFESKLGAPEIAIIYENISCTKILWKAKEKISLDIGNVVEFKNRTKWLYYFCEKHYLLKLPECTERYIKDEDFKGVINVEYDENNPVIRVYKDYTCSEAVWQAGVILIKNENLTKLTEDEIKKLKALEELGFKYIARNKNNTLYVYAEKPAKYESYWYGKVFNEFHLKKLFQFIKWEDENAYSIEELLNDK